ncbi:MAG: DNA gyrase subunit A [Candidatus Micrarchaeota archaeon]|nr:MAG: DNA gyrase subunit A [Candidatus Micrarchaeota archaeon]
MVDMDLAANIEDEVKDSYLQYAMSVIVSRALPDARDGLKPVQRRILYAMYKLGITHDKPFKKSARIVGEVIGKYHPHGDEAVYETLARMAQDFTMNYPLIEGQGNMGSIDGDPPAAQRYTEARLSKISEEMLEDIDKNVVAMMPNFDATEEEPEILPAKVPNLFLNGANGIAVAFTTNIMPHNLNELADAIIAYIDNNSITDDDLLNYIKGPDFPTGGIALRDKGLIDSYKTGYGYVIVRAVTELEESKGRKSIVIKEIPYTVNKSSLVNRIAELAKNILTDIYDIRDESDKKGVRVVIELSKNADPDYILNYLYKHTDLQLKIQITNVAVIGNRLVRLSLKEYIKTYLEHRFNAIVNRTRYDLNESLKRLKITDGLILAIRDIDDTVKIIRSSKDYKEAEEQLMKRFNIDKEQADAILDLRLSRLTSLEESVLTKSKEELERKIAECKNILENSSEVYRIIKDELNYLKEHYGRERKTKIVDSIEMRELDIEDTIKDTYSIIALSESGLIKRISADILKRQGRGGKGLKLSELKDNDSLRALDILKNKDYAIFITEDGFAYAIKAYYIQESSKESIGRSIANYIESLRDKKIVKILHARESDKYLILLTEKGIVKKIALSKILDSRYKQQGLSIIQLNNDKLIDAVIADKGSHITIATERGYTLTFSEEQLRAMGRKSYGVIGIRLDNDKPVSITSLYNANYIFFITSEGVGKIVDIGRFKPQRRGGRGIIGIKIKNQSDRLVRAISLHRDSMITAATKNGICITIDQASLKPLSRAAYGVRIIKLDNDSIVDVKELQTG